jgi:hypothetical protein
LYSLLEFVRCFALALRALLDFHVVDWQTTVALGAGIAVAMVGMAVAADHPLRNRLNTASC